MPSVFAFRSSSRRLRRAWWPLAVLVCGGLALAGALVRVPALTLIAAGGLLCAWLPALWRARRIGAWLAWLVVATLLLVPAALGRPALALAALPVVCLAAVASVFARTLASGREALITRCVRLIEGDARVALPGVAAYTRGVTVFWAWLLGAMALVSLLLALLARPGGWLDAFGVAAPVALPGSLLAWFPEVGCWGVLVAAFAGEYLFRRWYLRGVPQLNVARFVVEMARHWPALVRGGGGSA
ncbi:MAG TPA: xanthomonadin biosynthesis protein [Rhodanobacteraceae bacterium]|nr:xanthomonadin biosynthesis protein [Rhodanobacteraceae bacterium]